jgi:hypothetical protein
MTQKTVLQSVNDIKSLLNRGERSLETAIKCQQEAQRELYDLAVTLGIVLPATERDALSSSGEHPYQP